MGLMEIILIITEIIGKIDDVKELLNESDMAVIQENIQDIIGNLTDMASQHLVNQQRTNELLEMILLSLIVFITFYVLRMCLNKGAWS